MENARAVAYLADENGNDIARGFSSDIFNTALKLGRYITTIEIDHGIDNPLATDRYTNLGVSILNSSGSDTTECGSGDISVNYIITV